MIIYSFCLFFLFQTQFKLHFRVSHGEKRCRFTQKVSKCYIKVSGTDFGALQQCNFVFVIFVFIFENNNNYITAAGWSRSLSDQTTYFCLFTLIIHSHLNIHTHKRRQENSRKMQPVSILCVCCTKSMTTSHCVGRSIERW